MRRIQGTGPFAARDPEDDKKKARDSVLSNLLVFGMICGLIRTAPFIMSHLN